VLFLPVKGSLKLTVVLLSAQFFGAASDFLQHFFHLAMLPVKNRSVG